MRIRSKKYKHKNQAQNEQNGVMHMQPSPTGMNMMHHSQFNPHQMGIHNMQFATSHQLPTTSNSFPNMYPNSPMQPIHPNSTMSQINHRHDLNSSQHFTFSDIR